MSGYLYCCAICAAVAVGLIFAAAVDSCIENRGHINWPWRRKRGRHEIPRRRRDRHTKSVGGEEQNGV